MTTIIFIFAIFISIWFGFVNFSKLVRGHAISTLNIVLMAAGITAIITHIAGIW